MTCQNPYKMNGYTDLTTNIENSRNCLRRIARHDDQEFSNQSILNAMEKFVKTVNAMDETILVPCRLMDRKVGDATDTIPPVEQHQKQHSHHHGKKTNGKTSVREALNTSDLFKLYNMLNVVKVDLLWGRQDAVEEQQQQQQQQQSVSAVPMDTTPADYKQKSASPAPAEKELSSDSGAVATGSIKGHIRRPSTVSMASSNSASTLSDSESEISAENDSGIESESNADQDKSDELAKQFRTHLLGLYRSLEQMTEAANYLTARYQSDVGPV